MSKPLHSQRDVLREALGPATGCPPLDGLRTAPQDAAVERHLEQCPSCRAELALLMQFESAQAQPGEAADLAWVEAELARRAVVAQSPEPVLRRLRAWFEFLFSPAGRGRLSLAAAVLLVLVAAGLFLRPGSGVRPGQPQEPIVFRSGQVRALSPLGDLDQAPKQLRWEAVPGAAAYHVRLLEVDGTEIWSADSAATSVDFPANIAAQLTAARAFQWDVSAQDGARQKIASSNLQSFHIVVTRH
jgi:hypothetical protein